MSLTVKSAHLPEQVNFKVLAAMARHRVEDETMLLLNPQATRKQLAHDRLAHLANTLAREGRN